VAELTLENRLLKNSCSGAGGAFCGQVAYCLIFGIQLKKTSFLLDTARRQIINIRRHRTCELHGPQKCPSS
jgi:hypothetical protein